MFLTRSFIVFLLFLVSVSVSAQYVNTDELVIVPGETNPLNLEELSLMQDSVKELNRGYLAQFLIPGNQGYVISRFGPRSGRMHYGTDIKMDRGDTIVASQSGTVIRAGWGTGWGNLIILQHENNIETYYAHQTRFLVKVGDWVEKGEPIGLAGSTGRARGPHLHFEMRENGQAFDPELVFDFKNEKIREDAYEMESLVALHKKLKPKGYSTNVAVPEYYKVRSGDSLWVISRKFKTPINEICRLNRISENSTLQIGQPLRLY
ncbi:M23 family metallopeptidase [Prolixibacteraceae bacterium Z1-6]|uniref:M23 family metallopeptidase n=1 Tax=Draconibacterium aestuarii TaxID=2998507 RepID=A0A9X3J9G9_9BACT|nr:M23 family metallopeptidase [Prolixibacteraceae bacterium Z1-6]